MRPVRRLLVFHASSSHSRSLPSFANTNKILTTHSLLEFAPLAHRIPVLLPIVPAQLLARRDGAQREHVQARRRQPVIMQQACGIYGEHTQCRCRSLDDVSAACVNACACGAQAGLSSQGTWLHARRALALGWRFQHAAAAGPPVCSPPARSGTPGPCRCGRALRSAAPRSSCTRRRLVRVRV